MEGLNGMKMYVTLTEGKDLDFSSSKTGSVFEKEVEVSNEFYEHCSAVLRDWHTIQDTLTDLYWE